MHIPSPKPVSTPADLSSLNYHSPIFCEDFIVSDTLHETNYPDDNNDRPWWGLPCTVTPCFGARLVHPQPPHNPEYLTFSTTSYRELKMKTLPDTHVREASRCPSPVTIWQTLLTQLLDQHYGLTLNDTPFADERVIEQHIEAGISLCDAVNFLVEKYALVRTDQPGFSACTRSQLINSIDILRARRATGLMTRSNYRMVNDIIRGEHSEAKR